MPVYVYALMNALLGLGVLGAVVGLLTWSILTQHRQPGCASVRLRRRRPRIAGSVPPLARVEAERPAQKIALG
jgi:hypothetical protein